MYTTKRCLDIQLMKFYYVHLLEQISKCTPFIRVNVNLSEKIYGGRRALRSSTAIIVLSLYRSYALPPPPA